MTLVSRAAVAPLVAIAVACGAPSSPALDVGPAPVTQPSREASSTSQPSRSRDAIPFEVSARAYAELPSDLVVEISTTAGRWRCPPDPTCETAFDRDPPPSSARLEIRYATREGAEPRRMTRDVSLPPDVARLTVELRFEELVGHDHIWLARAAILRHRGGPASLSLAPDEAFGERDLTLTNGSTTVRYWSVDGARFSGRWERWEEERWRPVAPGGTRICTMLGAVTPLLPGEMVITQEIAGRVGRVSALPSGRLRYRVRAGAVIEPGREVPRAEARTRDPTPMLVDVFTVTFERTTAESPPWQPVEEPRSRA